MDKVKLIENLEKMKADIYYLSNEVSRISSFNSIEITKNELELLQIQRIESNLDEFKTYIHTELNSLKKRISELEINQESISEHTDDLDYAIKRIENKISVSNNNSSQKEVEPSETDLNTSSSQRVGIDVFEKIKEVEEHFSYEISRIYDNIYNEILDLRVEIKKLNHKTKSNSKKD